MRGKPEDDVHGWILLRIIPAHAGQTGLRVTLNPPESDHPRACGANPESPEWAQPTTGSSPRMRGKLAAAVPGLDARRIIPAHAGQTMNGSATSSAPADHPRACGANMTVEYTAVPDNGSSPRMRGKRAPRMVRAGRVRIIPAHAGQTDRHMSTALGVRDHPRACGANPRYPTASTVHDGSSPRMRGKRVGGRARRCGRRIIPAHAGQTAVHISVRLPRPDHPRACGANSLIPLAKHSPAML